MSYADEAALALDDEFSGRLSACLCGEAKTKPDDPIANTILRYPPNGVSMFMPFISTAPGFGDAYGAGQDQSAIDDGMLLSAVQASWQAVVTANTPPTPQP